MQTRPRAHFGGGVVLAVDERPSVVFILNREIARADLVHYGPVFFDNFHKHLPFVDRVVGAPLALLDPLRGHLICTGGHSAVVGGTTADTETERRRTRSGYT